MTHLLSWTLPTFNPVFVAYYLFYLIIEVPVMAALGLIVAGLVIFARSLAGGTATREKRALVSGVVAFICSSLLAYALFGLLQLSVIPYAVGFATGLLVGSVFALVSYRHTSEG